MQAVTQQMSIGWHAWTAVQQGDFAQAARCLVQLETGHWLRRWWQPRILRGLRPILAGQIAANQLESSAALLELGQQLAGPVVDVPDSRWLDLQQQWCLQVVRKIEDFIRMRDAINAASWLNQLKSFPIETWRLERLTDQIQAIALQSNPVGTNFEGDSELDVHEFPAAVMMWIDGIGGFLLVTAPEAWIGRYVERSGVQVALAADLYRRHARVEYWDNAHWLSLSGPGRVDGRDIDSTHRLVSGETIELGDSVELNYRQPYPNTGTATLSISAAQRTIPWSDAIILLGDSLMIGSGRRSHLFCPDWGRTLLFFRRRGQLYLRCGGGTQPGQGIEMDGRPLDGSTHRLHAQARIVGDQFAIKFEPLEVAGPQMVRKSEKSVKPE